MCYECDLAISDMDDTSNQKPKVLRMHQSYMSMAFGNIETIRDEMLKTTKGLEYDTLVGTGLSGALVVPTLARLMGCNWAIVRKSDGSHSGNRIEGDIGQKWLFVDDIVSSGRTLRNVIKTVKDVCTSSRHNTELVGAYQYQWDKLADYRAYL